MFAHWHVSIFAGPMGRPAGYGVPAARCVLFAECICKWGSFVAVVSSLLLSPLICPRLLRWCHPTDRPPRSDPCPGSPCRDSLKFTVPAQGLKETKAIRWICPLAIY